MGPWINVMVGGSFKLVGKNLIEGALAPKSILLLITVVLEDVKRN